MAQGACPLAEEAIPAFHAAVSFAALACMHAEMIPAQVSMHLHLCLGLFHLTLFHLTAMQSSWFKQVISQASVHFQSACASPSLSLTQLLCSNGTYCSETFIGNTAVPKHSFEPRAPSVLDDCSVSMCQG